MGRQEEIENLDRLIRLRDSDKPEERDQFNSMVANRPTIRIAIGYHEADLAKQNQGDLNA